MMIDRLDAAFDRLCRKAGMQAALMSIDAPSLGIRWRGQAQGVAADSPFCVASCTKLFTAALILRSVDSRDLSLDATAASYLPARALEGLHVIDGTDRSGDVTLRQLLSNTSGLADYFEDRPRGERSWLDRIVTGEDFGWTPEQALEHVRTRLAPRFAPGATRRAHYADTNFLILGMVLKAVTGQGFGRLVQTNICEPLGLGDTWVFAPESRDRDTRILPIHAGARTLQIPRALASVGCEGAVISTLEDTQRFLRGFFGGELFAINHLQQMLDWNRIFFPFQYGMGLMKFAMPPALTLMRRTPPLIGHSGSTGAVMYWSHDRNIFITGSTNQLRSRGAPYQFIVRALQTIL